LLHHTASAQFLNSKQSASQFQTNDASLPSSKEGGAARLPTSASTSLLQASGLHLLEMVEYEIVFDHLRLQVLHLS
jgi:hypothetical protein